ncbi:MAG: MdtA/MuxA family multidrug efflux RND transporter periplasmic adaptor subunit [Desulfuromonadales bacterium]|nr:MdtA/MuxA family multidrug efflux RND transporter periplasmic adaptor subunit [Desulfuromonadales bacterium]
MFISTEVQEEPKRTDSGKKGKGRRWWVLGIAVIILVVVFFVYKDKKAASSRAGAGKQTQAVQVTAIAAKEGVINSFLNGLGTVTPVNTVIVKSMVDGQLMEIHFKEGQYVQKGALLALIDPRPFQVQLTQAQGQLMRDQQQLSNARLDLQRYKQLWSQDSIPKQQLDTQVALVGQLEGVVKTDKGAVDSAKLQLIYCRITAPVSGQVGLRQVDLGNIIHTTDTNGVVVITQVSPMTVIFPIPEDSLSQVLSKFRGNAKIVVDAFDRENKQKLSTGVLQSIDNQIDTTTGTVRLRAAFQNDKNELFPNQFVNARLHLETFNDAIIVPTAAIQHGNDGTFVYIVNNDKTVSVRPITVGITEGDNVSITKGVANGDLVVIEGSEKLRDGTKVDVREADQSDKKGNGNDLKQPQKKTAK